MDRERGYMIMRRLSPIDVEDDTPILYEHLGTWESPESSCEHAECAAKRMVANPPRGVEWQPGDHLIVFPMRDLIPVVCVVASDPSLN